jgi:Zn-dependent alcohol dehydrogenase
MVDGKLQTAQKFGATDLVNARDDDSITKVMELTDQRGADVAFEVIGLQATIDQAFTMTRRGGQTVLVGVPAMDVMMTVPVGLGLIFSEKQIRGCLYGSSNVHHDIPMLANLYAEGKLMLDELVSHEITLEGVNKAMDDMSSGEVTRSVIVFGSTSEPTQREAAQPDLA